MAGTKLHYCMIIVTLLCVKVSVGAQLSSLQIMHRRGVEPVKEEEKPTEFEPTEASTASSAPSVRPKIEESTRECTRFEHTYCNSQFEYEYGLFPNHKGQTAKEAATELNHFSQLFNADPKCSDKIGVFLCFTYFPLCTPNVDGTQLVNSGDAQLQEVLPCKETCEEVHKSECTEYVLNATSGDGWAEHLSCDQAIFKPEASKQCANGESGNDDEEESTNDGDNGSENCQSKL